MGQLLFRPCGRRYFIAIGLGLYVCVSILYLFPPGVTVLITARFLQGVAAAFLGLLPWHLSEISPQKKEGTNIASFDISFYSAMGLGPIVGALVRKREHFGMPGIFRTLAAITVISFLIAPFLIPDGRKQVVRLSPLKVNYITLTQNTVLMGLLCFIFTRAVGISLFTIFLPLFMESYLDLSGIQIGIVMASGTVLMMVFLKPMGLLADHQSRRMLVFVGGLLAATLTFCLPFATELWGLFFMTVVLGFGSVISLPASVAMIMEEGDHFGMGLVFGLFNTTMNLGFAVAPFLGNFIVDLKGLPVVFYFAGFIGIAGVVSFYICSNKRFSESHAR